MAVGISSSCYYPLETERSLQCLADAGIHDTEVFFNAQCETKGSYLKTISDVVRRGNLKVHAVHSYCSFAESHLVFSPYKRRMFDGIEVYKGLCDAANTLGAKYVILHGEKEPFRISDEEYIERFAHLEEIVRSEGILLTQENVVHFRAQSPAFLEKMRSALGEHFHMTFDVKQAVRSGYDPLVLARQFADCIAHAHISDHGELGDCLAPGKGDFSFESLFSILNDAGYRGQYMIELYRSSYTDENELLQSFKKVSKIHAKSIEKNETK